MSILDPLKNYCERSGAGLWDEPLNAISNLAFFIAAWLLWKTYRKQIARSAKNDTQIAILIVLLVVVGIGSTLFHTFANKLTMILDVLPIACFTYYYLWVALRRLIDISRAKAAAVLFSYIVIASQIPNIPDGYRFNESVDYFPCLAALLLIGGILKKRAHPSAHWLLKAGTCFSLSLTLRSVDFLVCPHIPIGTHFLWHVLNGLILYLLVCALFTPPQRDVN